MARSRAIPAFQERPAAAARPRSRSLRAVFLDVGNTLLREVPSRFALYARAARARGLDVDEARMHALMREAHAALPRELAGAFRYSDPWFAAFIERVFHGALGLPRAELPALVRELFARFEDPASFHVFPGAHELVADLAARGVVVGVVSNWSARLPRLLAALGLDRELAFVVCSALARAEKPEPAIFAEALARAGVPASDALHAGDHPERDCRGARRAGIEPVQVLHGGPSRPTPASPGGKGGDWLRVGGLPELRSLILGRLA